MPTEPGGTEANRHEASTRRLKPFVRWAGSKRLLITELRACVPKFSGSYIEPFLGGGSLFLELAPERAILNDSLAPLMSAWRWVGKDPERLADRVESWPTDKATYVQLRGTLFSEELDRAAQFLYLNRNAYGGLWRLNRKGVFNVPWSAPKSESSLDRENLHAVSDLLKRSSAELLNGDYLKATAQAKAGDLVFLDPPYSKGRPVRPFVHYNEALFGWEDQQKLAGEARRLVDQGAHVVVTNSAHPDIVDLYADFRQFDVMRSNALAARSGGQAHMAEKIFVSG